MLAFSHNLLFKYVYLHVPFIEFFIIDCNSDLEMRNGLTGDSQITDSSSLDSHHGPRSAMLFRPLVKSITRDWFLLRKNRCQWLPAIFMKNNRYQYSRKA